MNNQVITIESVMLSKYCILFCRTCETNTKHALGTSRQIYVCGQCGEIVDIETNEEIEE